MFAPIGTLYLINIQTLFILQNVSQWLVVRIWNSVCKTDYYGLLKT